MIQALPTTNSKAASSQSPSSQSAADLDLARRVALFLATKQVGDLRRLEIKVSQGRVRLSGRVVSFYHRQLAISLARRVSGVLAIEDQILVADHPRPTQAPVRPRPRMAWGPARPVPLAVQ